jgi:hypothetical protein
MLARQHQPIEKFYATYTNENNKNKNTQKPPEATANINWTQS